MNVFAPIIACATCLPDQGSEVARAANMAILFMVVVVLLMLGLLLKVIFNFARKQRQHSNNLP